MAAFDELRAALIAALGTRVTLKMLTGDEEAGFEIGCARAACEGVFREGGKGAVNLASAGGATCQFFHPALASTRLGSTRFSVEADVFGPVETIRAAGPKGVKALKAAADGVLEEYAAGFARQEMPRLPPGAYCGITMLAEYAELAGLLESFQAVAELRGKVDAFLLELYEQQGAHPNCVAKWPFPPRNKGEPTQAERNWPIGVATGLRLRALLGFFEDDSSLYFVNRLPPPSVANPPEDGRRVRAGELALDWPIGKAALALLSVEARV